MIDENSEPNKNQGQFAKQILEFVDEQTDMALFHDQHTEAFASFFGKGLIRNFPLRGAEFKGMLSKILPIHQKILT